MTAFLAHTDPPIDGCDTAPVNEACAKVAGLQQEFVHCRYRKSPPLIKGPRPGLAGNFVCVHICEHTFQISEDIKYTLRSSTVNSQTINVYNNMTRRLSVCDRTMVELPRRRSAGAAVSEAGSERSGAAANVEEPRVFRSPKGHS